VLAQDRIRVVVEPGLVSKLHGRGSRERGQQRVEQRDVLVADGRKLEEHRPQPLAQDRDALRE